MLLVGDQADFHISVKSKINTFWKCTLVQPVRHLPIFITSCNLSPKSSHSEPPLWETHGPRTFFSPSPAGGRPDTRSGTSSFSQWTQGGTRNSLLGVNDPEPTHSERDCRLAEGPLLALTLAAAWTFLLTDQQQKHLKSDQAGRSLASLSFSTPLRYECCWEGTPHPTSETDTQRGKRPSCLREWGSLRSRRSIASQVH